MDYRQKLEEKRNEIENRHNNYKNSLLANVKVLATAHGANGLEHNIESIKDTYITFTHEFRAVAEPILTNLYQNGVSIRGQLKFIEDNPSVSQTKINTIEDNHTNQLEISKGHYMHKKVHISNTPSYVAATEKYLTAKNDYEYWQRKTGRNKPVISKKWYYVILFLLGISEFYLNYSASATLGGGVAETVVIALAAGIIFPVCAHYLSKFIRQEWHNKNSKYVVAIIIAVVVALAVLLARLVVQSQIITQEITTDEAANNLFWMRITMVLGIFLVGSVLAYFNFEPNTNFLESYHVFREALRTKTKEDEKVEQMFEDAEKEYKIRLKELENSKVIAINSIHSEHANKATELADVSASYESLKSYIKHSEDLIIAWKDSTITSFRTAYRNAIKPY